LAIEKHRTRPEAAEKRIAELEAVRYPMIVIDIDGGIPSAVCVPDVQHRERFEWTPGQWAEQVGGHYQGNAPANYYEFGSFMAAAAMLCQFGTVQQKTGWNACRAAMLQGADGNSTVIPEELISAMEEVLRISDRDNDAWHRAGAAIAKCREVMSPDVNGTLINVGYISY